MVSRSWTPRSGCRLSSERDVAATVGGMDGTRHRAKLVRRKQLRLRKLGPLETIGEMRTVVSGWIGRATLSIAVVCTSCAGGDGSGAGTGGSGASTGGSTGADPWADGRQKCVDAINAYRAQVSAPPYTRWTAAEPCVDQHAAYDSTNGAHAGFIANICQPRAFAEDECPGGGYKTIDDIVNTTQSCFTRMWSEGPGGGHYANMSSTTYTLVACGFYRTASGSLWATQDFR